MAKRRNRPPFAGLCLALVHAEDKIDGRGTNTRRAQGLTRGGEEKLVDNDYFKYKLRAKLANLAGQRVAHERRWAAPRYRRLRARRIRLLLVREPIKGNHRREDWARAALIN